MSGYLAELNEVRNVLDSRDDQMKSGVIRPIDGEGAFRQLRNKNQNR